MGPDPKAAGSTTGGTVWNRTAQGIRLRVRVQPRSSRDGVVGRYENALKIRVTAPPVEGAANEAVVQVLATWLRVPKRSISVVRGRRGREKIVDIVTEDADRLIECLRERLGSPG